MNEVICAGLSGSFEQRVIEGGFKEMTASFGLKIKNNRDQAVLSEVARNHSVLSEESYLEDQHTLRRIQEVP